MKWLCYVASPRSRCQKSKSVAICNAWIGRFQFLMQKQNAIAIQSSITYARQKEIRSGAHVNHGYSNEFLDSDRTVNVYFTYDVDAKNRIRSLNEFSKINLNAMRREGMHDDGVYNDCQFSDQELDDEIVSVDSQADGMNHNEINRFWDI